MVRHVGGMHSNRRRLGTWPALQSLPFSWVGTHRDEHTGVQPDMATTGQGPGAACDSWFCSPRSTLALFWVQTPPPRQGSRPLQKGPHWGLVLLIRSLPFNYPQVHARHLWGCLNPTLTSCAVGVEGGGHRHQGSEWGGTGSRSHSRESRAGFEPCPGWLHSLGSCARKPTEIPSQANGPQGPRAQESRP